jgi:S-adenosylmethionine:tRNA-ribosyltransferase-isomerase (queuine synthetase)
MNNIHDLESLRKEKKRLEILGKQQQEVVKQDFERLKKDLSPGELAAKAATSVVPEPLRRSAILNVPINFLAKTVFGQDHNVVSTASDKGEGNKARNIALGLIEGVGTFLLTRYLKRKL